MQSLEKVQLLEAVIVEVTTQVVQPVVGTLAAAEAMDMSAVGPGTSMGPGMPVQSEEMLLVLKANE